MTFESIEEIRERIENPINEDMLKRANQIRVKHELHVSGIGLDEYIDKIQGVENENAVSLRRALGKTATVPVSGKIISIENKIFSARGGGRYYDFSNENDQKKFTSEILTSVRNDMSMSMYMKKVWKDLVNVDPSGIILTEITEDGMDTFFSYKSSASIHDIFYKSSVDIEYIIFKPEQIDDYMVYRVIDDSYDYTIKVKSNNYIIEEQYINPWGFVPAVFLSDRQDKKSIAWDTHISEAMIYADDMLLDYTIYKVYKTRIGIPAKWEYARECATCEGSGQVISKDDNINDHTCTSCRGSGTSNHNRDVADIYVMPIPEQDDVPLTPPLGYVVPDLESWSKYEETLDRESNQMFEAVWGEGITVEGDRRNITASELLVRGTSQEHKLNEISDNEENVEKRLTDILGIFYYPSSYQGAIVNNGRNYELKTVQTLEKEYNEAIKNDLPTTTLTNILSDLYHTQFKTSPQQLNAHIVKLSTKPFFHWMPDRIQGANVNQVDYYKNIYYDEFAVWYEHNKEPFGLTTIDKVQKELDKWILDKLPKEQENVEQNTEQNE